MAALDPRALEEATRAVHFLGGGQPSWQDLAASPLRYARCSSDAAIVLRAYLDVAQPVVETVDELEELPVGTIVVDGEERPAVRQADEETEWWLRAGSELGWVSRELPLPARVIFSPGGTR